jgi:hypothetical protein
VNLTSTIGSKLEPMVSSITSKIGTAAINVSDWMEKNKELSSTIVTVGATIGAALIGFGTFSLTLGLALKFLPLAAAGFKAFNVVLVATKFALAAVSLAGKTLLLNPIFGALAAVIGFAAYVIWDNWGTLKPKFTALFTWFSEKFTWFSDVVSNTFSSVKDFFGFGDKKSSFETTLKTTENRELNPDKNSPLKYKLNTVPPKTLSTNAIDSKKLNKNQNVTIQKIEINNPSSTVEVEKGVAKALNTKATSLSDEEF